MSDDTTNEPVLCYVEDSWAFFTTQPLADQWGDDWNDAPYEHNAGEPYMWREGYDEAARWDIVKVAWEGPFDTPSEHHFNSPYSVQAINGGAVAWLSASRYSDNTKSVQAGVTLDEFCRIVTDAGGRVFK